MFYSTMMESLLSFTVLETTEQRLPPNEITKASGSLVQLPLSQGLVILALKIVAL